MLIITWCLFHQDENHRILSVGQKIELPELLQSYISQVIQTFTLYCGTLKIDCVCSKWFKSWVMSFIFQVFV